jgi:hypothetical protein
LISKCGWPSIAFLWQSINDVLFWACPILLLAVVLISPQLQLSIFLQHVSIIRLRRKSRREYFRGHQTKQTRSGSWHPPQVDRNKVWYQCNSEKNNQLRRRSSYFQRNGIIIIVPRAYYYLSNSIQQFKVW